MYNMFDPASGDVRFALFLALTDLCVRAQVRVCTRGVVRYQCTRAQLASQIVSRLSALDALVAAWKVSPATGRPLYYAAHRALTQVMRCCVTRAR
jgi:hypothetical protein